MINPVTVVKAIGEKKQFIQNHQTFYSFMKESFGEGMLEGTLIEIKVKKPDGCELLENVEVQKSDEPFFDAVKSFFD